MKTGPRRILLVEDEAIIALARRKLLEKNGYQVEHASSGEAAVKAAPGRFDLVLMDIELGSGMKGTDAAARIAAESEVPIVFLSSQASPETFAAIRDIPHYGYVSKSSSEHAFFSALETAFSLSESHVTLKVGMEKYRLLAERAEAMTRARDELTLKKDKFLRETHRRMRGGIEVITEVLGIQETELVEGAAASAVRDARRRLFALRTLYDKLFTFPNYGAMPVREYLEDLAIGLVRAHAGGHEIAVETCVEDFALDVGRLLPLGLIVQELIAISLEQAFPAGRSGIISLAAYRDATGQVEVVLGDDGVELKETDGITGGIGPDLVKELARLLSATVEFYRRGGTTYRIRFMPEEKPQ